MVRTVVSTATGFFFTGMGLYALAAPARLGRPFGITADNPSARSQVRAVYGGFGLGVAAVLLWSATTTGEPGRGVVLAVAVALAGMAAGRAISRVLDAPAAFYPVWFYFWVETLAAAALFAVN
ncbi:DUF4345 domain-containing protein [Nocardia carnea]|uniref:DUF4345 domain-containing protein n=1 Tax=Nocardia carnea TaxID=37328 RepID=UPI0024553776|nr:DUF4345 domain-containing protein [Nocardia carnea]